MEIYQHFRREEQPFIDQILNWKDQVEEQYVTRFTDFLDPREQHIFKSIIGNDESFVLSFSGGVEESERKQAMLAPFYVNASEETFPMTVMQATFATKFITIEHRDVLGSVLSLGLTRKKIGDIVVDQNDGVIQLVVSEDVGDFILMQLTSIKKATVRFKEVEPHEYYPLQNEWKSHETTVSSMRLDVLVKHFYSLSRNQALDVIKKGRVKVNFKQVEDPAFIVAQGDLLSFRGKGRSQLDTILKETKKKKWRIRYRILLK
ncbi:RNA-binding protein YlmH, contains S4-like domain [Pelagirhabdus alkalitolerans]|uniref:RNA-binding protein YlmH, contains S4-like domain n=1 Tax=Pelagirhabdus alkalitolerans TaxID=1612202 RepID=A0A1G6H0E9_9BACI|nr:YlmH/Sll1252 family protein [Pelagirhabdus alkalitolerans]SDB87767.1 RNA-binding protein YlmH, contains S4-like domain [Pelagirhabdus alkalitolerans]